ncbi:hypothetical protein DV515_00019493, partial [Chloebia gouldiae]
MAELSGGSRAGEESFGATGPGFWDAGSGDPMAELSGLVWSLEFGMLDLETPWLSSVVDPELVRSHLLPQDLDFRMLELGTPWLSSVVDPGLVWSLNFGMLDLETPWLSSVVDPELVRSHLLSQDLDFGMLALPGAGMALPQLAGDASQLELSAL